MQPNCNQCEEAVATVLSVPLAAMSTTGILLLASPLCCYLMVRYCWEDALKINPMLGAGVYLAVMFNGMRICAMLQYENSQRRQACKYLSAKLSLFILTSTIQPSIRLASGSWVRLKVGI